MFTPTHNRKAVPFISLEDGHPLPVVSTMRLLGLLIDSDLTWWPLVTDLTSRCKSKIWSLLRLREAGADIPQLVTLYTSRVRSTVEYSCQVYGGLLSAAQSKVIDDVQVRCCQIILGQRSASYSKNLATLELERLDVRRTHLMSKFAVSWWFERNQN